MKSLALYLKLFSDETRLRCLYLIKENKSLCVCELTYALALSQPKISRHLTLLRAHDVISDVRKGKWVYYSINTALVEPQKHLLDAIFQELKVTPQSKIDQKRLKTMQNRPNALNCC